jgi:hypothetical protein
MKTEKKGYNIKPEDDRLYPMMANATMKMQGELLSIAHNNGISRNEVIRMSCEYLIKNKKKFNLL